MRVLVRDPARLQGRAWLNRVEIVSGDAARKAFDLDAEPREVRERYGFIPEFKAPTPDRCGVPAWSQRMLLARRLVEAGVRLVTVDLRWWDTHVEGIETMRDGFLPRWDRAFSALVEDLTQRGLMKTTMVVAWGEFGRTPKINGSDAGRDHWAPVMSAVVAGGGLKMGQAIGASSARGEYPKDRPYKVPHLLATLYRAMGIDPATTFPSGSGRPMYVLDDRDVVSELV